MDKPGYIPQDYTRIKVVESLDALFDAPFEADVNCILYPRRITGAFNDLARYLYDRRRNMSAREILQGAYVPEALQQEKALMLEDIERISANLTRNGAHADAQIRAETLAKWEKGKVPFSLHFDGCSNPKMGRVLCCYNDPVTEWARNEDIIHEDDEANRWKFRLKAGAPVYQFQPGDIWRLKSFHRGFKERDPADAGCFAHRTPAPTAETLDKPRLLLVAG